MAKRLLLNILVDVLDDYVEGLSIENLKLGVLSGKIELNNLQLKRTGLDKLNLPISITHGSLKSLKLKIPWTALESKPVRVIIDGVYLQAGPLDVSSLSPEQLKTMAFDAKRVRLKAAEDAVMAASQTPEGIQERTQKASYVQQLTAKIVDNIEITLTNVHIRYEDSLTYPQTVVSAGITIASISLTTTDDQWNEAFVARETKSRTSVIHKLGSLENIGVYWNTQSKGLNSLLGQNWEREMQNLIYVTPESSNLLASPSFSKMTPNKKSTFAKMGLKDQHDDYSSLDYILAAPNSLHVKIVHTEHPVEGEPKIDVAIESTSLFLNLDKRQYQQVIGISVAFSLLEKQKQISLLRPHRRPTRDPRGWWHYAFKLVTGRTISTASKMDMMMRCMKIKKRYITLVKRSRYFREANSTATTAMGPSSSAVSFTALDESELRRIEESIPIQALLVFRQFAAYEIITEMKRDEREMQKEGKGKNLLMASFGWTSNPSGQANSNTQMPVKEKGFTKSSLSSSSVSSWFKSNMYKSVRNADKSNNHGMTSQIENQKYSKKAERAIEVEVDDEDREEEEEDEKIIAMIQSRLNMDPMTADQFSLRLVMNSGGALRLTSESRPVALLEVAMSSTTEMKADGIVVQFALDDFQLIDECTLNPLNKFLIVSASAPAASKPEPSRQHVKPIIVSTVAKVPLNPFSMPSQEPSSPPPSKSRRATATAATASINPINSAPKFLVVMDSRHGKSVLRLTARPMEATWNEACVGRLLGIFMSPDITHNTPIINANISSSTSSSSSSSSFSPLLAASMNKFAMDAAIPIAGEMEVIIEFAAPKIIIPDDCFRDTGCLLLDAGYLVIKGVIGETSMFMDVSLSNVNVGMPLSVHDKCSVEGRSLYLLRPFDVKVAVKTLDPTVADVTVAVSVSPGLKAEFDAVKVARLIKHLNTIVSTMQEAIDPSDIGFSGDIPVSLPSHIILPFLPDSVSEASASKDRSIVTAAAQRNCIDPSGVTGIFQTISPTHCYVDVTVDLPLISIQLLVTDFHSVLFLINGLDAHVLVRQNDLQVYFALKSLRLSDSLRGEEHKAIIFTPPLTLIERQNHRRYIQKQAKQLQCPDIITGDTESELEFDENDNENENEAINAIHSFDKVNHNSNSLINIRYTFMYNRQSPLFISHGQELMIEFTSLGLSIDDEAVMRLKPFLEKLSQEMAVSTVPVTVSLPSPNVVPSSITPVKVAAIGPIGMLMTVSIGCVSLSLMRSARSNNKNENNGLGNIGHKINGSNNNHPGMNPKLFSRISTDGSSSLEGAFSMVITDMFAAVDMRLVNAADIRLRSFTILDSRPISENYIYKEIFCRSTFGSEHNSVAYSSIDRNRRSAAPLGMKATQENDSNILSVMYREGSKESGTMEIELRNMTSFISVDSVIELADVVMCNVTAVLAVTNALSGAKNIQNMENDMDYMTSMIGDDIYTPVRRDTVASKKSAKEDSAKEDSSSQFSWLNSTSSPRSEMSAIIPSRISSYPGASTGTGWLTSTEPSGRSMQRQESMKTNGTRKQSRSQTQSTVDSPLNSFSPIYGSTVKETQITGANFLFNVIVSVISPRLLLLEDPESIDSRAIVIKCAVSVHYCNDSKVHDLTAETIHISLQTLEIFALTGLTHGRPQQIMEPTGIELHINRRLEATTVLSTSISLDVDVVVAKISVNDIVLANSILSRAKIVSIPINNVDENKNKSGTTGTSSVTGSSPQNSRGRSSTSSSVNLGTLPVHKGDSLIVAITMYDLVAQLGSMSLIAVNDYNGMSLPILRLSVDRSDFRGGGKMEDLTGEGSFQISAEHYNTRVAEWEPLIEKWGPRISLLSTLSRGMIIEVISDDTLQIDVSGAMVKTFSQLSNLISVILEEFESHSQSLLNSNSIGNGSGRMDNHLLIRSISPYPNKKNDDNKRSSLRSILSDKIIAKRSESLVTFKNCLEFPIEIFDSMSHESLMVLRAGDNAPLMPPGSQSRSWVQNQGKYPILFDIRVLGRLKDQRLPLLQLPLNVNKARPYCLQPNLTGSNIQGERSADRSRGSEPIVEEAYENQRYDPLGQGWSTPWTELNDPFTWSDILGTIERNPSSVHLPSDRWDWVESDWKVDLSGIIGDEIDEKGWEYATNFPSFTVSKKRRTKKSMDVVRRRRWIRSRMPKSSASDELLKPLTIIWDVKALQDGSRLVLIRSGLQLKNLMPFPLSVAIDGFPGLNPSSIFQRFDEGDQDSRPSSDKEIPFRAGSVGRTGGKSARIFDNIPEGETFSLPLLLSSAYMMKVKPSGKSHQWSKSISCRLSSTGMEIDERSFIKEIENKNENESERSSRHPSHFRSMVAPEGVLLSARHHHDLLCPVEGSGNHSTANACIQGLHLTSDRSRLVACVPYAYCHNHLPCKLSYKFLGGDGHSEEGTLAPGASRKLGSVNLTSRLLLFVQIGVFAWSAGQLVDSHSEDRQTLDLYFQRENGGALSGQGVAASLSMTVTLDHYHTAHIKIFSRLALIDRTGLDASVRTKRILSSGIGSEVDFFNKYTTVERRTYAKRRPQISTNDLADEGEGEGEGVGVHVERRKDPYNDFDDGDRRDYFPDDWDDFEVPGVLSTSNRPFNSVTSPTHQLKVRGMEFDPVEDGAGDGLAGSSWVHGAHGLVLFHSDLQDSKFSVGINKGAVWSDPLSLLTLGVSKVPFELIDKNTKCAYQLAHSTTQLPGAFKATQLVTIMPCYCVVNCLAEHIEMRQVGTIPPDVSKEMADINRLLFPAPPIDLTPSRKKCSVDALSSAGWHRYDITKGTAVQIRCDSSAWSLGTVDLNDIGTTVLLVPKKKNAVSSVENSSPKGKYDNPPVQIVEDAFVLHVEVRFADPTDHSYVNIVVWAPIPDTDGCCHQAALSIRNDTMYPIIIKQTGSENIAKERRADPSRFTFKIPPGAWKPFGWMDQKYGTSVTVTLDPAFLHQGSRTSYSPNQTHLESLSQSQSRTHYTSTPSCAIDILKIGQSAILNINGNREDENDYMEYDSDSVELLVTAVAGGQVLHIRHNALFRSHNTHSNKGSPSPTPSHRDENFDRNIDIDMKLQKNITFVFSLKSFGVSLIAERPARREFMSLYMDGIDGRLVCEQQYLNPIEKKGKKGTKKNGLERGYGDFSRIGSVFTSYELEVNDMQIDNYSETAVFPVCMHSFSASHRERKKAARRKKRAVRKIISHEQQRNSNKDRVESDQANSSKTLIKKECGTEDFPFIAVSIVQEKTRGTITPIFKYVAIRILEIKAAMDSSTLQLYFCDLHSDLRGESREEVQAGEYPMDWIEHFNHLAVTSGFKGRIEELNHNDDIAVRPKYDFRLNNSLGRLVDIAVTLKAAQESKMYFESLIIHPIKLRLSFLPTPFPRSKHEDILSAEEYRGFKFVRAIAQVDELIVKISYFHLTDTMDSMATLGSRILAKILRDLQSHSMQILGRVFGSLEFIGKPAGLYRNVGEGVKEFFYEPYEGLMHSPEAFVAGLGKGTGGLMRGVVSGAITSTAAIVGSASKGLAKGVGVVTGDKVYVRQREEKRRINTASSGGVLSGIKAGSESMFSGFASGITGLVTRPFEEGRRGGALGFVKGIGLGVAGVVTKPILGVSDGIASLVHGISNQVSDAIVIKTARPPRAFHRSATDVTEKVLVPLDLAAAHAQHYVLREARRGGYIDSLISHMSIDGSRHGCFSSELSQTSQEPSQERSKDRMTSTSSKHHDNNGDDIDKRRQPVDDTASPSLLSKPNIISDGSSVIVSEMFIFVLRTDGSCGGRYAMGEISHCVFHSDIVCSSVELILYQASRGSGQRSGIYELEKPFNIPISNIFLFGDGAKVATQSNIMDRQNKRNAASQSSTRDIPRSTSNIGLQMQEEEIAVKVQCKTRGIAVKLYQAFAVCASQMGNPSSVLSPDIATSATLDNIPSLPSSPLFSPLFSPLSSSVAKIQSDIQNKSRVGFQNYRFGKANSTKHAFVQCSEKDLLLRAARRLAEPVSSLTIHSDKDSKDDGQQPGILLFAKFLDERVWQSVCEWRTNHQQLQSSRCLATLIINQSDNPVQILRTEVQEGRNVVIFGVSATSTSWNADGGAQRGYDEESRTLKGGGSAVVVFAFGFLPTPIDMAHVRVNIVTSAFNATVSTRPNRTSCVAVGGYTAGYLEKSLTDYWSKYVIIAS